MPIVASDIEFRYSGGSGNTSANACLGGAISTAGGGTADTGVKNDLFDDVTSSEAAAGSVEYRGIYVKNNHGTITLEDARIWVSSDTSSASDELDIGVAVEAVNASMATIANETTAPTSVVFSHPTTYAGGLALNGSTGLTAGSFKGVWVRRTVTAGAGAASVTGTLSVQGNTA